MYRSVAAYVFVTHLVVFALTSDSDTILGTSANSVLPDKAYRDVSPQKKSEPPYKFTLDVFADGDAGNLSHFWESTGFW